VKIIDRVKAYIRQKKGRARRSTGYPLDGAADPVSAQRDRARHKQNRDDKRLAVSTAHERPEPKPESAPESATEPATVPAACPRCGATGEAPCTTPSGNATKTHKGREQ
jgi:hypothetical protein